MKNEIYKTETETSTNRSIQKQRIYYSRDYRYLRANPAFSVVIFLLVIMPVIVLMAVSYSTLTNAISEWAGHIVAEVFYPRQEEAISVKFVNFIPFFGQIAYLSLPTVLPSYTHALVSFLAALFLFPAVYFRLERWKPLSVYFSMALLVQMVSCVFFLFRKFSFPYTLTDYSQMYMMQMTVLMIVIPMIFGVSLTLLIMGVAERIFLIFLQIALETVLCAVRYVVYLAFLCKFSVLYMAVMFFMFGFLADFMLMVMLYTVAAKRVGERFNTPGGRRVWRWS